jgi:hypothetical protein
MLRLPRQAHYSICDKLCARDTARLIETASQWSRKDDPRHAALRACVADRVARARVVTGYVGTIASPLQFIEAVERRDWEITPTGRDGDCNGQLEKILRSYTTSFSGGLKDGDDIVFPPGGYRLVRTIVLDTYIPQITFRRVDGPCAAWPADPQRAILYADRDTVPCLFHIPRYHESYIGPKNPVIQFSGLTFSNDWFSRWRRKSIVCRKKLDIPFYSTASCPNIVRMNDCHVVGKFSHAVGECAIMVDATTDSESEESNGYDPAI